MATTTKGNGTPDKPANAVATDDFASLIEDDAPKLRANSAKDATPFVPNPVVLEKIAASFGRTGAFTIARVYPDAKDARKSTALYLRHAQEVVATSEAWAESKSVALDALVITPDFAESHAWAADAVNQYRVAIRLTHKRVAKSDKAESETTA